MQVQRKTLTQLSIPICFETLFYMLAGMVDTLMLSSVSDQAVGAVGTANTYISVFIIMFGIISSGMVAVMTQNIGAGKPGIAYQARQLGLIFNAVIGVLMSVFLAVFSGNILKMVSIAPALFDSANTYLRIVGGACFLNALIPIYSSYLRVFGYTKQSLWASIIGNVINFILNAVFLFVMHWGVGCCHCNGYLTYCQSDYCCHNGRCAHQGKGQSRAHSSRKNSRTDYKDWLSVCL